MQHHHQGIDMVGDDLRVTGWSDLDELPEAIELPGRRFVLGVQWHPEADPGSPVIEAFVAACAAARQRSASVEEVGPGAVVFDDLGAGQRREPGTRLLPVQLCVEVAGARWGSGGGWSSSCPA